MTRLLTNIAADDRDFLRAFDSTSPSKASTSSIAEVEDMLAFNPSSSSSMTSSSPLYSSPVTSALQRRRLFASAPHRNDPRKPGYNPRMLPDLSFGEDMRPLPRPIARSAERAASFFNDEVVAARRNSGTEQLSISAYPVILNDIIVQILP